MISESDRKLEAFEDSCASLQFNVEFQDGSFYTVRGVDVKAFYLQCKNLGMTDFQLVEVTKAETYHYWNMKQLPTKTDNLTFQQYIRSNTYPQPEHNIKKISDIYPVVLYHRFIRTPRLELIFDALGASDHLLVVGKDDDIVEVLNRKRTPIVESVEPRMESKRKRTHLTDFQ
jgi:hypothetical protein